MTEERDGKSRIFDPETTEDRSPESPPRDPETGRYSKFPPSLLSRARRLGFTSEELRDIESAEELRSEIRDREFNQRLEKVLSMQDTVQKATEESKIGAPSAIPELSEDHFDSTLVSTFRAMKARIEDLEKQLGTVAESSQRREQQEQASFARRIEKQFSKYPEIFGEGLSDKIDQRTPEFHLRVAAAAAHQQAGGLPEDLEANIDRFVSERFFKKSSREQSESNEVDDWVNGVLGKPTQSGPQEQPAGKDKALSNLRMKLGAVRDAKVPRGAYLKHGRNSGNNDA